MLKSKIFDFDFQDVTMKVISFAQQGPTAICILSASGLISSVTFRQPDACGGTLTYEVRIIFIHIHIFARSNGIFSD